MTARPRRVWIDLSNSPHPILFEPIVEQLRALGHEVVLSARDHAQTVALARQRWDDVDVIGDASPRDRLGKARDIAERARALAHFGIARRADVAVSHNSYAQTVAARLAGIPCVTAMDYEYQPANHIAFRFADRILVPQAFPDRMLRREGGSRRKVRRYHGFKEEAYLHGFRPDPDVLRELGLADDDVFLVARPSPQGATYHQFENRTFDEVVARALRRHQVKVVLLPRRPEDLEPYVDVPADRRIVPERPVDARSLMFYAAAMLGAGGTMNREAALLGTPVVSMYEGRLAAVDRQLLADGRFLSVGEGLVELDRTLADLTAGAAERRRAPVGRHVLDRFVETILEAPRRRLRR